MGQILSRTVFLVYEVTKKMVLVSQFIMHL